MTETSPSTLYTGAPNQSGQQRSTTRPFQLMFIASDFPPMLGGIAQFMYDIIVELPPERAKANVITIQAPGWVEFDAAQCFPIHRIRTWRDRPHHPSRMKFLAKRFLQQLLEASSLDFVICNHGNLWLMLTAWIHQQLRGTPYGVFLHGYDIFNAQFRYTSPIYNGLLRRATLVFANGSATAAAARKCGIDDGQLVIIPPCVTPENLIPRSSYKIRKRYGIQKKRIILTVGRLVQRKGVDQLINAMPPVLAAIPDAHLVIVGDGPERLALESKVRSHNLVDNITFAGAQSHDQVADFYRIAEVFAMTTHQLNDGDSESFGIVYLEANMLGLPVVATNVGGVADAVVDGETGLLVDDENPDEIAAAILRLLENPALAARLADQGKQRVLNDFTCKAMADKFISAVEQRLQTNA